MSDVGDVESMISQSIAVLEDEERLAEFKDKAYQRALQFDIQHILPLYESVYEKAYAQRHKKAY